NSDLADSPLGVKTISKTFNYDKFGNVIDIHEYNGYIEEESKRLQRTSLKYDVQNRIIEKRIFADASASQPEVVYGFSYDQLGRLAETRDGSGAVVAANAFNAIGQLSETILGQGSGEVK